jgi:hypothetical protein
MKLENKALIFMGVNWRMKRGPGKMMTSLVFSI